MEVIEFISNLKKKGAIYYQIWLPILLQFKIGNKVTITIVAPTDIPKSTYYRVIKYGITIFPIYVKNYKLSKSYSELVFLKENIVDSIPETNDLKQPVKEFLVEKNNEPEAFFKKPKNLKNKIVEAPYPNEVYEDIINYFNITTGKKYRNNSKTTRSLINSRLDDGFVLEDFKKVILTKTNNWKGTTQEQYLRPETLFSNKFESYLNENIVSKTSQSNLKNTYDQVSIATEFFNSQG